MTLSPLDLQDPADGVREPHGEARLPGQVARHRREGGHVPAVGQGGHVARGAALSLPAHQKLRVSAARRRRF